MHVVRRLGGLESYVSYGDDGFNVDYEGALEYGIDQGLEAGEAYAEDQARQFVASSVPVWGGSGTSSAGSPPPGGMPAPPPAPSALPPAPPPPAPIVHVAPRPVVSPQPAPIVVPQTLSIPRPTVGVRKADTPWMFYALVAATAYGLLRK